jgi:GDP-mannose 6-dehydrogenase
MNYRAKELDLKLPLFEAVMPSNDRHLGRAVDMVLQSGKKKVGQLGLSFKAATDDLRESPQVVLAKCLLGEGRELRIWDENVSLGRLIGSNRQYINEVIPHIGSLLCQDLKEVVEQSEIIIIATRVDKDELKKLLRPEHIVIDLVNLDKSRRPEGGRYEGICW